MPGLCLIIFEGFSFSLWNAHVDKKNPRNVSHPHPAPPYIIVPAPSHGFQMAAAQYESWVTHKFIQVFYYLKKHTSHGTRCWWSIHMNRAVPKLDVLRHTQTIISWSYIVRRCHYSVFNSHVNILNHLQGAFGLRFLCISMCV